MKEQVIACWMAHLTLCFVFLPDRGNKIIYSPWVAIEPTTLALKGGHCATVLVSTYFFMLSIIYKSKKSTLNTIFMDTTFESIRRINNYMGNESFPSRGKLLWLISCLRRINDGFCFVYVHLFWLWSLFW